jgi:hypothetical protein
MSATTIDAQPIPARATARSLPAISLALFSALVVFLAVYQLQPPAPASAAAPPTEFSAARAAQHLGVIAKEPRALGTAGHDAARAYILKELSGMGLSPQVQTATVLNQKWNETVVGATVQNVLARLDGTHPGKAILLVGHYDTVADSPGASDDGSAVVAMLETLRALKAGAPLKNDVIFLFTDGEETGLMGARAFVEEHPWAKDVGLALNMEARGNSGPALMFETSEGNGRLVEGFAGAGRHPVGNSLSYEIYKLMPNDTDLTVFKRAGMAGLNFALIGGVANYHAPSDTVERMNPGSLQHQGANMLAMTRHFGDLDPNDLKGENAVYFDAFGSALVNYPGSLARPLAVFAALLFAAVFCFGWRRKQLTVFGAVGGFLTYTAGLVVVLVVMSLLAVLLSVLNFNLKGFIQGATANNFYVCGFVCLTLAVSAALYNWFRRKISAPNLAIGALAWWLTLTALTAVYLPGGSYLFTWPLLCGLAGLAVLFATRQPEPSPFKLYAAFALAALPGLFLLAPMSYLLYTAMGLDIAGILMFLVVLLLGLYLPYVRYVGVRGKWATAGVALLVGAGLLAAGGYSASAEQKRPNPNSVSYIMNADSEKAVWFTSADKPDEWASPFFAAGSERGPLTDFVPLKTDAFLKSPAPAAQLAAPQVRVLGDETADGVRNLRLSITSPRQAARVSVYLNSGAGLVAASVNGKKVEAGPAQAQSAADAPLTLNYTALPAEGIVLTLTTKSAEPLRLRVADGSFGLPEAADPGVGRRASYLASTPFLYADSTIVTKSFSF